MKIRIKFAKSGDMVYIGHLDMMRYFQKAFRRTDFDMTFTQGFHPHHIMSFASPLGVGLSSEGDYMDVEMNDSKSSAEMIEELNAQMAEGVRILSFRRLPDDQKTNAMASLKAASYRVTLSEELLAKLALDGEELISRFLDRETIMMIHTAKKTTSEIDIKPMIHELTYSDGTFHMLINSGSSSNLRPEVLLDRIFEFGGYEISAVDCFKDGSVDICRTEMYTEVDGRLVPMEAIGEEL